MLKVLFRQSIATQLSQKKTLQFAAKRGARRSFVQTSVGSSKELSKFLLQDPSAVKMGWSKEVISSVIPMSSQVFSTKGKLFDNIAVRYCPQREPMESGGNGDTITTTRRVDDSFIEIILPLNDHSELRESMVESDGKTIQYGKMFELFDGLAGDVAYRHAGGRSTGITIVTACIDGMQAISSVHIDQDVKLQGYLTYVGKSSMEVSIDLITLDKEGNSTIVGQTQFIMVARTAAEGRAFPIHGLELVTEEAINRFALGASRVSARKARAATSLALTPPKPEEIDVIHNLYLLTEKIREEKAAHLANKLNQDDFLEKSAESSNTSQSSSVPSSTSRLGSSIPSPTQGNMKFRFMKSTVMNNVQVMPSQERNVHGKVFGGYILRKAYEIARVCAIFFYGKAETPEFCFIDEVQFVKPVATSSIMEFTATAVFSQDGKVVIQVVGNEVNPQIGRRTKTNILNFAFKSAVGCHKRIPEVIPKEYPEIVLYLEGMRAMQQYRLLSSHPNSGTATGTTAGGYDNADTSEATS